MKQSSKEIQEMFMTLPFSETMKNCIEETDWQFADSHIATIIYNFPFPYFVRRELLEAIHDNTEDETLKTQLGQRFEVDDLKIESFKQPLNNTVFAVKSFDFSDIGTFSDFDSAMESVKDYNDEFCIEKIQTLSEEAEPAVKNFSFPFRNMGAENQTEFWDIDSAPDTLGTIYFNEEKLIHRFWSVTPDNEFIRKVDSPRLLTIRECLRAATKPIRQRQQGAKTFNRRDCGDKHNKREIQRHYSQSRE